jgi:hypothetical protein
LLLLQKSVIAPEKEEELEKKAYEALEVRLYVIVAESFAIAIASTAQDSMQVHEYWGISQNPRFSVIMPAG